MSLSLVVLSEFSGSDPLEIFFLVFYSILLRRIWHPNNLSVTSKALKLRDTRNGRTFYVENRVERKKKSIIIVIKNSEL